MGNPPSPLSPAEQKRAARTPKARQFFVFLRMIRHELRDAALQTTLAQRSPAAPGGKAPVEAGVWALAMRCQASGHVGEREAVERTVMDKRWQLGLDGLGAEPPPLRQGTRCHVRLRLIQPNLDNPWLERTGAGAAQPGGGGARQLRAALDATPLFGAGRVEDTCTLRGPARRQAVGRAAQALGRSAAARVEAAGRALGGQSRRKAAWDRAWGAPTARASAWRVGLEEGERWQRGREPQSLSAQEPPMPARLETRDPMVAPETEPEPEGGPDARRLKTHVAPDRRRAMEDAAMRHGRQRSAKPCNGFQEHGALALDRTVTREVVVCPAPQPEHAAVERRAEALEPGAGRCPLESDLGEMARPRLAQGAAQGVHRMARPWPHVGPRCTNPDGTLDCQHGPGTGPNGQTVPRVPGKDAQCPARAGAGCPGRAPCTQARRGHGRSRTIREAEPCPHTLRAKIKTKRGRASRRPRTAVEQAIAPPLTHQGRRARDKGLRKNQFDGRRHAAVSNLQVAARYDEERRLAS